MSTPIIEVRDVHRFFGSLHAVRGISFDVSAGQVLGFIGANGAGKTTTMRMMATLDVPDLGSILIGGIDTLENPLSVKRKIGWMPDSYGTYEFITVREYLDFFARSYGYVGPERNQRIEQVMDFTELRSLAGRYVNTLSKGMGQRLCLGRTLLHDPEILILDEPAAGLDPKARVEFKHLVRLLANEGKAIFISSHILSELEDMCDSLLFIDAGSIVHHGSAEALKSGSESSQWVFDIKSCDEPNKLEQWLILRPNVRIVESIQQGFRVQLSVSARDEASLLLRAMMQDGIPVFDFHQYQQKLEDAFIEMVEKRENGKRTNGQNLSSPQTGFEEESPEE